MTIYDEMEEIIATAEMSDRDAILELLKELAVKYADYSVLAVRLLKFNNDRRDWAIGQVERALEMLRIEYDQLWNLYSKKNELVERIIGLVRVSNSTTAYLIKQELDRVG